MSDVASIPNVGPRAAHMFAIAGIRAREPLAALSRIMAYFAAKQANASVSLNLMRAMATGLNGVH